MSFPHDRTSLGDLIAQHHDPFGTWGAEQGSRRRQGRVRFLGFDKSTGEDVFDRYGWHHGDVCWLATGAGLIGLANVWQQAFPALIVPAPTTTQSGPSYKTNVVGPLAQPAYKQSGGVWIPDTGLLAQAGATPLGMALPVGFPVTALGMSTLDEQQLALIPSGNILVAVKGGGALNGVFGTRVYDIRSGTLDFARWARDHSHWSVYLLPIKSEVDFSFGGASKQPGATPGGLAWELGPDVDQQGGHGVCSDLPTKAGTPTPTQVSDGFWIPHIGLPGDPGAVSAEVFIQQYLQSVAAQASGVTQALTPTTREKQNPTTEPPKTQEKRTPGGAPKTVGKDGILGVASYRGRGPLCVGELDDAHLLARTPEGQPVNSLHEHEGAIIIGDTGDAPRKHDKGAWITPRPDGPFTHEVYHRNDPSDTHDWMGKTLPGLRKWQGTDFTDVPTPSGDPRPGETVSRKDPIPPPVFPKDPKPKWPPVFPPDPGPDNKWDPDPQPGPKPQPGGDTPPDAPPPGPHGVDGVDGENPGGSINPGVGTQPGGIIIGGGSTSPSSPLPRDGFDGFNPGGSFNPGLDGPVPPQNPGGTDDGGGRQRSYPAFGTSMGVYEIIARGAPIQSNLRDPRYQFDGYTKDERKAYDNGPAALRINGFSETSGGVPIYDGPQCGKGDLSTGTAPVGGVDFGASDSDLNQKLRNDNVGKTTRYPTNTGLVNHGYGVDGSFGEINTKGKPANGVRYGRSFNPETGDKFFSIEETDSNGDNKSPLAILLDFALSKGYLFGDEIITSATLPASGAGPGVFGDGSDGAASFNGGAVTGCTFDGAITYTANRDLYFSSMTMTGSYRLVMNGYKLFVDGTLTIGASNNINNDGQPASLGTPGGQQTPQSVGGGYAGGAGVSRSTVGSTNGNNGTGTANSFGGSGGGGGAYLGVAGGGSAGAATAPAAGYGELRSLPQMALAKLDTYQGTVALEGGGGGGAGGVSYNAADSGTHTSGAGGGAAGVLLVAAKTLINNGNITARGGPGGVASTTGAVVGGGVGGGGGGGGGLVIVIYEASGSTLGSILVSGGNGGSALGTGVAGANGSAGKSRTLGV